MKRGTPDHYKVDRLMNQLGIDRAKACGTIELMWHTTAKFALLGDLGAKLTDAEIARSVAWDGDASKLIESLCASGWMDRDDVHRLVVHDWHEHCDEFIKKRVARAGQKFASLTGRQRQTTADNGDVVPSALPMPMPMPQPPPPPQPEPTAAAAVESMAKELESRGATPARARHFASALPATDLRELIGFFDRELAAGRLRTPDRAWKSLLEDPAKWGFKTVSGRLKAPSDGDAEPRRNREPLPDFVEEYRRKLAGGGEDANANQGSGGDGAGPDAAERPGGGTGGAGQLPPTERGD